MCHSYGPDVAVSCILYINHIQYPQLAFPSQVGASPEVDERLAALRDRLTEEVGVCTGLMEVQGALEPLLAAALAGLSVA